MERVPGLRHPDKLARRPATRRLSLLLVGALLLVGSAPQSLGRIGDLQVRMLSSRAVSLAISQGFSDRPPAAPEVQLRTVDGAPIAVQRIGLDRQVAGFSATGTPLTETRLHILLAEPLPTDAETDLRVGARHVSLRYDADAVSPAIQVNQVGYPTSGQKFGYVGEWLGTAGALPVDSRRFEVIDRRGRVVTTGLLVLRSPADPWSGNDVYEADFSTLEEPGEYRLRVNSVGVSYPFSVGARVYDPVYRTVARLFYHSRNSTPIERPFADPGYERAAGISAELDGMLHDRVPTTPLGADSGDSRYRPVRRGWFDAGDYGQYMTNAAPVWYAVSAAMDLAAGNFRDGDLGIPESGNGLPDLIDELEWGMDWALSMQGADGGVYSRIASRRWDNGLPAAIEDPRLIAERTTHATAAFAAMGAIHARLLERWRPERAERVLRAARNAWTFATTHPQWPAEGDRYRNPPGVHAGEYADTSARDALAWAAAELYRTTGDMAYLAAFEAGFGALSLDPTSPVSFRDQGMAAAWAYLMTPSRKRDPVLARRAHDSIIAGAEWRLRQMDRHPFRAAQHPAIELTGWGNFAHSTRATLPLLQAWWLSNDERYRRAAWITPGAQLGANPQSTSYITGVGSRSPRRPLSKLSQHDAVDAPLNGIPVNGPHYHLPALWESTRAVNEAYFPSERPSADGLVSAYPALRRYTDSDLLPPMSEPTIAEIALTAVAFGLLRDEASVSVRPAQR